MYRGFETILLGRAACDGLVIAPRICGICSTSHLTAAALALDMISGAPPPPDAVRIRNLALMAEHLQSDMRQAFLMFAVDFPDPAYAGLGPLHAEAVRRYEPFRGDTVVSVIRETKKVVELIAILGGQWPHSSFIVPGGIVSVPGPADLLQCRHILRQYRRWYEERILGCSVDRWRDVKSAADLSAWLDEDARAPGQGAPRVLRPLRARAGPGSPGAWPGASSATARSTCPRGRRRRARAAGASWCRPASRRTGAGGMRSTRRGSPRTSSRSWFEDQDGGRHPLAGETRPYATGHESRKYSWAKAPRYEGAARRDRAAGRGAGARRRAGHEPRRPGSGPSAFSREMARLVRPASLLPAMETWLDELMADGGTTSTPRAAGDVEGAGVGLTQATAAPSATGCGSRRAAHRPLPGHRALRLERLAPRRPRSVRGPTEEALVGTTVQDSENPVALGHVVRSFDPCLVCTVHAVSRARELGSLRVAVENRQIICVRNPSTGEVPPSWAVYEQANRAPSWPT